MAVNGREIDWGTVVRTYSPRVRRLVARRLADPAAVEDVVQETFIQAYRKWSTYDPAQPLGPWLATIAANRCWRRWQAMQRRGETEVLEEEVELPDYFGMAGSDEHVARLDREAAVHLALRRMTPRHRRVLYRWELERRSTTAMAATEQLSPEALKIMVVRARRNFREYFLAVAGEGPFAGVLVGLTGLFHRWRDKASRVAASSGWVEATGAWVTAPVVAAASMAMLTLAPTTGAGPPAAAPAAGQPIVAVHDTESAVPSPEGPPVGASAPAQPRPTAASPTSGSTEPTSAPVLPVRAAVQPSAGTTDRGASSTIEADNPAGSKVYTVLWTDVYCDGGVAARATCKALDAADQ